MVNIIGYPLTQEGDIYNRNNYRVIAVASNLGSYFLVSFFNVDFV